MSASNVAPPLTGEQVLDELEALGSSDAIAAHLLARGERGCPLNAEGCPLAKHLSARTGQPWYVSSHYAYDESVLPVTRISDGPKLPPRVLDFRRRFDDGKYGELLETT